MGSNQDDRDIVLFLGAGFSCDVGFPTMAMFGDDSKAELRELRKQMDQRQDRKTSSMLRDAGRVFTAFQEYCRKGADMVSMDVDNMETVFCIAEAMSEAEFNPEINLAPGGEIAVQSGRPEEPLTFPADTLLKQIQMWLWDIYQGLPPLNKDHRRYAQLRPRVCEEFLQFLNSNPWRKRTTVLSTNYDLVVEYYTWAMSGFKCGYPFAEGCDYMTLQAGPATWDSYLNTRCAMSNPHHESDVLLLCKLHGSVNFFELGSSGGPRLGICDDIAVMGQTIGNSRVPRYDPPPSHESGMSEDTRKRRPAIFVQDAIWSLRERYGSSLVPAIIPPTYAKLQRQPWLRRTWNRAFRAIKQAKLLIFIGYSMPESDGFMRAMIQGALASRTESGPEVYVVNPFKTPGDGPSEPDEQRYKSLFPTLGGKDPKGIVREKFADAWQKGLIREIFESKY